MRNIRIATAGKTVSRRFAKHFVGMPCPVVSYLTKRTYGKNINLDSFAGVSIIPSVGKFGKLGRAGGANRLNQSKNVC